MTPLSLGRVLLYPGEQVVHDLIAIRFVQHLVAAVRIVLLGNVRDSRRAISLPQRLQPFEIVINRIFIAGE